MLEMMHRYAPQSGFRYEKKDHKYIQQDLDLITEFDGWSNKKSLKLLLITLLFLTLHFDFFLGFPLPDLQQMYERYRNIKAIQSGESLPVIEEHTGPAHPAHRGKFGDKPKDLSTFLTRCPHDTRKTCVAADKTIGITDGKFEPAPEFAEITDLWFPANERHSYVAGVSSPVVQFVKDAPWGVQIEDECHSDLFFVRDLANVEFSWRLTKINNLIYSFC